MELKELRYNIMLALYFPILLYAFSTFDLSENVYAVEDLKAWSEAGRRTSTSEKPSSAA